MIFKLESLIMIASRCKIGSVIALGLALTAASPARADFSYYTSTNFFTPPDTGNFGVKVDLSGGGFTTPRIAPSNLNSIYLGTASFSTSTGSITSYSSDPNTPPNSMMAGPIMTNISTTIITKKGMKAISIGGIISGMADYSGNDFSNGGLSENLTLAAMPGESLSGSVVIGDETYTLTLLGFPSESDFIAGIDPTTPYIAEADLFGSITVTSAAVPEPGSLALIMIGGGILGTYAWARRTKNA